MKKPLHTIGAFALIAVSAYTYTTLAAPKEVSQQDFISNISIEFSDAMIDNEQNFAITNTYEYLKGEQKRSDELVNAMFDLSEMITNAIEREDKRMDIINQMFSNNNYNTDEQETFNEFLEFNN